MWREITEDEYDFALGVLPPAMWVSKGFLLGEPFDHRVCRVTNQVKPTYAAFVYAHEKYWEGDPLTVNEFVAFDVNDLLTPKH